MQMNIQQIRDTFEVIFTAHDDGNDSFYFVILMAISSYASFRDIRNLLFWRARFEFRVVSREDLVDWGSCESYYTCQKEATI